MGFGLVSLAVHLLLKQKQNPDVDKIGSLRIASIVQLALIGYIVYDYLDVVNLRNIGVEGAGLFYGGTLVFFQLANHLISLRKRPSPSDLFRIFILIQGLALLYWGRVDFLSTNSWQQGASISMLQGGLWVWFTCTISSLSGRDSDEERRSLQLTAKIGIVCLLFSLTAAFLYIAAGEEGAVAYFNRHSMGEWLYFLTVSFGIGGGFSWLAVEFWCRASKLVPYKILSNLLLADVVAGRLLAVFLGESMLTSLHLVGAFIVMGGGSLLLHLFQNLPPLLAKREEDKCEQLFDPPSLFLVSDSPYLQERETG